LNILHFSDTSKKKWNKHCDNLSGHWPNDTNPAFADNASVDTPFSSGGGVWDHEQGGVLLSPAVRLASTNS